MSAIGKLLRAFGYDRETKKAQADFRCAVDAMKSEKAIYAEQQVKLEEAARRVERALELSAPPPPPEDGREPLPSIP